MHESVKLFVNLLILIILPSNDLIILYFLRIRFLLAFSFVLLSFDDFYINVNDFLFPLLPSTSTQ